MATETFFKEIVISKEAAEIMAAEAEKPRKPYIPKRSMEEILRSEEEWLKEYRLKKLSAQKRK